MKRLNQQTLTDFYENLLREEKSAATADKYLRDARAFCRFAAGRCVTKELVIAYKRELLRHGYAVRSVNSMIAGVNSLLLYLGLQEARVKSLRLQKSVYRAADRELTKAEYLRLLEAARGKLQTALLLQTLCATGIRVSELQYFTVEAAQAG